MRHVSLFMAASVSLFSVACASRSAAPRPTPYFEVSSRTEAQLRDYLREAADHLDPIEGIWHLSGSYSVLGGASGSWDSRLAIIRDTTQPGRDFVEVYLERDESFPLHAVTAHFTLTATPGVYVSKQFSADGSYSHVTLELDSDGQLIGSREYERGGQTIRSEWRYLRLEPRTVVSRRSSPERPAARTGSGFLLTESGVVITNQHVIDGMDTIEIQVPRASSIHRAWVLAQDRQNDLVALQMREFRYTDHFAQPIPFRIGDSRGVVLGEEVFTLGFPLGELMGSSPRLSVGHVDALYGIDDDPRLFQISNPIQPGNSGGPLLNRDLEVIGVVVSTLDAGYLFERARIIPQNVNFAVKSAYLEALLGNIGVNARSGRRPTPNPASLEEAIELVRPYVVEVRSRR